VGRQSKEASLEKFAPWIARSSADSTIALDADTGKIKWHFQHTPNDPFDYDSVAETVLADVTVQGDDDIVAGEPGHDADSILPAAPDQDLHRQLDDRPLSVAAHDRLLTLSLTHFVPYSLSTRRPYIAESDFDNR
jgi:PQQ enzyme repeat